MQNYSQIEDEFLIQLISESDSDAFTELYNRYKDKLFGFAMAMVDSPEKAYDLVQDVFLKIWEQRLSFAGKTIFSSYLYTMVRNFTMDHFRLLSRDAVVNNLLCVNENGHWITPEANLQYKELQRKVQIAISRLPPRQKQIYAMHREERLKYNEIAEKLNLSVSTVENHFSRAITSLRLYLNNEYSSPLIYCLLLGISQF